MKNKEELKLYFEALHNKGYVLGLENMKKVLSLLDHPDEKYTIIHVAGTNGKGSCCTFLEACLREAGYRTGCFTSPENLSFYDRIKVMNQEISEDEFIRQANRIRTLCEERDIPITEFEMITCIALNYFKEQEVDFVVLEVGMGGRLDATNAVSQKAVSVIMHIGLDHMSYLGNTKEQIAREKSGIIMEGVPVVVLKQDPSVLKTVQDIALSKNAPCYITEPEKARYVSHTVDGLIMDTPLYKGLKISMIGQQQYENALVVLKVIELLSQDGYDISEKAIRSGFLSAMIPGRMEVIRKNPLIILDGAHNPQAAKKLSDNLYDLFGEEKFVFVVGFFKDKEYLSAIENLRNQAKIFLTVSTYGERGLEADKLAEEIQSLGLAAEPKGEIERALADTLDVMKKEKIIIFGTLSHIAAVKNFMKGRNDGFSDKF